jgi:hypothetical protein
MYEHVWTYSLKCKNDKIQEYYDELALGIIYQSSNIHMNLSIMS